MTRSYPLLEHVALFHAQLPSSAPPLSGQPSSQASATLRQWKGLGPHSHSASSPVVKASTSPSSSSSLLAEQPALAGLLSAFAGDLLVRQKARQRTVSRIEALYGQLDRMLDGGGGGGSFVVSGGSRHPQNPLSVMDSTVAEEGLYVQVPAQRYIEKSRQWTFVGASPKTAAGSGGGDSHQQWQELPYHDALRYCRANHSIDAANARNDEGFLYGFAILLPGEIFLQSSFSLASPPSTHSRPLPLDSLSTPTSSDASSTGPCATEGLLLCVLSTSPVFTFARTVALNTVSVLYKTAHSMMPQPRYSLSAMSEALSQVIDPLQDLINPLSAQCCTLPGRTLSVVLGKTNTFSFKRPADLLYSHIDTPLATLLHSFSYDALRVIHTLMLQERRIVFIGFTPQHASACVVSALSLISPMQWCAPLIPYLPAHQAAESGLLDTLLAITSSQEVRRNEARHVFTVETAARDAESNGFMIGSTPPLVGEVMLRMSAIAASYKKVLGDVDRVWIVDARTGNVGVTPLDPIAQLSLVRPAGVGGASATSVAAGTGGGSSSVSRLTSTSSFVSSSYVSLDVLPANERLRAALKGAVSSEQRLAFRLALETTATLRLDQESQRAEELEQLELLVGQMARSETPEYSDSEDASPSESSASPIASLNDNTSVVSFAGLHNSSLHGNNAGNCGAISRTLMASVSSDAALVEVHAAILEYNAQRLFGNYRRGILTSQAYNHVGNVSGFHVNSFLPGNLDNFTKLADAVSSTHVYQRFQQALLSAESLGLSRVLRGDFVFADNGGAAARADAPQSASLYYLSHPRAVAMLNLFFERCKRSFPELFTEFSMARGSATDGVLTAHRLAAQSIVVTASGKAAAAASGAYLPDITAIAVGDPPAYGPTVSPSSGGGMKKFFAKMKSSLSGKSSTSGRAMTLPLPVFIQALPCLGCPLVLAPASRSKKLRIRTLKKGGKGGTRRPSRSGLYMDPVLAEQKAFTAAQKQHAVLAVDFSLPDPSVAAELLAAVSAQGGSSYTSTRGGGIEYDQGNHTESGSTAPSGALSTAEYAAAVSMRCRPLPLDVVHQFSNYHHLLRPSDADAPDARTSYFASLEDMEVADAGMPPATAQQFLSMGPLCPSSMRMWQRTESMLERALLRNTRAEELLPVPVPLAEQRSPRRKEEPYSENMLSTPTMQASSSHTPVPSFNSQSSAGASPVPCASHPLDALATATPTAATPIPATPQSASGTPLPYSTPVVATSDWGDFSSGVPDGYAQQEGQQQQQQQQQWTASWLPPVEQQGTTATTSTDNAWDALFSGPTNPTPRAATYSEMNNPASNSNGDVLDELFSSY